MTGTTDRLYLVLLASIPPKHSLIRSGCSQRLNAASTPLLRPAAA